MHRLLRHWRPYQPRRTPHHLLRRRRPYQPLPPPPWSATSWTAPWRTSRPDPHPGTAPARAPGLAHAPPVADRPRPCGVTASPGAHATVVGRAPPPAPARTGKTRPAIANPPDAPRGARTLLPRRAAAWMRSTTPTAVGAGRRPLLGAFPPRYHGRGGPTIGRRRRPVRPLGRTGRPSAPAPPPRPRRRARRSLPRPCLTRSPTTRPPRPARRLVLRISTPCSTAPTAFLRRL